MGGSVWPFQQGASRRFAGVHTLLRILRMKFLKHVSAIAPTPFMGWWLAFPSVLGLGLARSSCGWVLQV